MAASVRLRGWVERGIQGARGLRLVGGKVGSLEKSGVPVGYWVVWILRISGVLGVFGVFGEELVSE